MSERPNYIIFAPEFREESGGVIFLHRLVHELNNIGERAFFWPSRQPIRQNLPMILRSIYRKPSLIWKNQEYNISPDLNTPVAHPSDLKPNSIVVYPEITLGNPLNARNVVRWLLYKPGLRHPYEFGKDEMFFRVGEITDLPDLTGIAPDLFLWKINSNYKNENRPDREGACFIIRKGSGKTPIRETEGAVQIDGLSHKEIANIFNSCKIFYSFDEATFYSQYAAICGCLSVVIPGLYNSRTEWVKNHQIARYGIAYGLDDLEHAQSTSNRVLNLLREEELKGLQTVKRFVELTQKRFVNLS